MSALKLFTVANLRYLDNAKLPHFTAISSAQL